MIKAVVKIFKHNNVFLNWIITYKYSFIGWAAFLFYEIVIVGLYTGKLANPGTYIFHYLLNISIFYFHALIVLKYGLKYPKQIIWRIPVLLFLEVAAYLCVTYITYALINKYTHIISSKDPVLNTNFYIGGTFRAVYFIIFSTGYYFLITFIKERKKTELLEQQRLNNIIQLAKSENAFLRAQTQPHLLFNTLDFIYHNAKENSPVAAETIIALSSMMRYTVDSKHEEEFVNLRNEIEQVETFINLHQLINNHSLQIRLDYEDEVRNEKIIPMVLITLVENIFKHGELKDRSNPAFIKVVADNENLLIETKNIAKNKNFEVKRIGTGIDNIRKRLDYTYGGKVDFKHYFNDNEHFNVKITIKRQNILKDNA